MKFLARFTFMLVILCCSACRPSLVGSEEQSNADIKISLFGENDELMSTIVERNKAQEIIQILEERKPLMEKIMPIFTMQIVIEKGGQQEVWLFSKPKYLKKKSKSESQVYYIDKVEIFNTLVF